MEELKMGDTIEVSDELRGWVKRIYIQEGFEGVLCVAKRHEEEFRKGKSFDLTHWRSWRRLEEKKYRPFTWEEKHQIAGFWVRHKKSMDETMITELYFMNYVKIQDEKISFTELLENYIFLDGSPCGVEE